MPKKMDIWNKRMIMLMEHCLDRKICTTQGEFLESIGFAPNSFKKIDEGSRSFTVANIAAAVEKYKVNANWLLGHETQMMRGKSKNALQNLKDAVREVEASWK